MMEKIGSIIFGTGAPVNILIARTLAIGAQKNKHLKSYSDKGMIFTVVFQGNDESKDYANQYYHDAKKIFSDVKTSKENGDFTIIVNCETYNIEQLAEIDKYENSKIANRQRTWNQRKYGASTNREVRREQRRREVENNQVDIGSSKI